MEEEVVPEKVENLLTKVKSPQTKSLKNLMNFFHINKALKKLS